MISPSETQPASTFDANGQPILLRPGRTWVNSSLGRSVDIMEGPPVTSPPTTAVPTTTTTTKPKK